MPCLFRKENYVLSNKTFSLQNFLIFCLLVDFYNSMKYGKFQITEINYGKLQIKFPVRTKETGAIMVLPQLFILLLVLIDCLLACIVV